MCLQKLHFKETQSLSRILHAQNIVYTATLVLMKCSCEGERNTNCRFHTREAVVSCRSKVSDRIRLPNVKNNRTTQTHSKREANQTSLSISLPVALETGQGHRNHFERATLKSDNYHHTAFESSCWQNTSFKRGFLPVWRRVNDLPLTKTEAIGKHYVRACRKRTKSELDGVAKVSRFYWAFCPWWLQSKVTFTQYIPYKQVHEY